MLGRVSSPSRADRWFLFLTVGLALFGLAMLFSASAPAGYDKFGDQYWFVKRQILFGFLPGIILLFLAARVPIAWWQRVSPILYWFSVGLLVLVFVPGFGLRLNGALSWLAIGSYSFQPVELIKLTFILVAARYLSAAGRDLNDWSRGLMPVLVVLAPVFLLVALQPDFGALAILAVVLFAMLYAAGVSKKYLSILGVAVLAGFCLLISIAPYRLERLTTFLHPELDPKGVGYQVNQAFLAVGSGGFWGLGFGHSRQKFQYLPETSADSIFAVIAEEMGLVVSGLLVVGFLLLVSRGLKIAKNTESEFGRLAVLGIAVWLGWQAFLNIGAMVGALPLTGVPLPFVSHGGSALLVMLVSAGIVYGVSRH